MNLSSIITGVPEYIEFGWVVAPNTASQSISANSITTLTLNTEVADTGNLVSAPSSNQFTLPSGTYYFETSVPIVSAVRGVSSVIALYNVSDSAYVSRGGCQKAFTFTFDASYGTSMFAELNGQFVTTASKTFDLRIVSTGAVSVTNAGTNGSLVEFTSSTSGADQRTTIKLWKLK